MRHVDRRADTQQQIAERIIFRAWIDTIEAFAKQMRRFLDETDRLKQAAPKAQPAEPQVAQQISQMVPRPVDPDDPNRRFRRE